MGKKKIKIELGQLPVTFKNESEVDQQSKKPTGRRRLSIFGWLEKKDSIKIDIGNKTVTVKGDGSVTQIGD